MPITQKQLAALFEAAYDAESNVNITPEKARKRIAEKQAAAIAQFVIGRITKVVGTSATGGAVTGKGTIQT